MYSTNGKYNNSHSMNWHVWLIDLSHKRILVQMEQVDVPKIFVLIYSTKEQRLAQKLH